ncbi:hypothetical protein PENSTE_c001G09591 [Penicillium steckii]|uniref:Putative lipase ATG15 n=1 Tax=Penicillium steckii TaxID=303698 RepID=A0A1V6U163_9EURO|nr:hypothetical protein PENSTE_c001G09591 [Penicillium steckii]
MAHRGPCGPLFSTSLNIVFFPLLLISSYINLYALALDWNPTPPQIASTAPHPPPPAKHEFTLRHIFHKSVDPKANDFDRIDVGPETRLQRLADDGTRLDHEAERSPFVALSNPLTIQRLADRRRIVLEEYRRTARLGPAAAVSSEQWTMDTLSGPNITDKTTVLNLARMSANDYIEVPGSTGWHKISGAFNYSSSFGWRGDGLRGHIYADKANHTVIISLKGTSPALFDGAGTTTNDKDNDNLFFSCCCGQGGSFLWRQVCDCQKKTYTANLTCIIDAMSDENRYYASSIDLYFNVTKMYPNSNVWLTGHSLGGAMTSLLGLTFGLPVVTFEAVPEALPAARLGLPSPPGYDSRLPQSRPYTGAFHFGHTADPVYMGTCNGINSFCTWGGYALESACHTGQLCTYDTVADKGWSVSISRHSINPVIYDVLEAYEKLPNCAPEEECVDCALWKFFKSNGSEGGTTTTTSTTTSTTATRTSICKTPGWWGCLDESTTTTSSPSVTTTAILTTSHCETPGILWGCWDESTTTTSVTSTLPPLITSDPTHPPTVPGSATTSSHCKTPGLLWGCWDEPTSTTSTTSSSTLSPPITSAPTQTPKTPSAIPSTSHCRIPGILWGCWD